MDPVEEGTLVAGGGLEGSADQGGRRQITLIEEEVWAAVMGQLAADADPSSRRANLMVSGIALRDSRERTLLVGSTRIRVNGELKPCERMDEAVPGLSRLLESDWKGGAYGAVIEGGRVRIGDEVRFE